MADKNVPEQNKPIRIGNAQLWNFDLLPELHIDQYRAITEVFRAWLQIKAQSQPRLTDEQRACLRQLDVDIWHSSLLHRMLQERKLPLSEPPPTQGAYPVYPADTERLLQPEHGDRWFYARINQRAGKRGWEARVYIRIEGDEDKFVGDTSGLYYATRESAIMAARGIAEDWLAPEIVELGIKWTE